METITASASATQKALVARYISALDKHISEVKNGEADEMYEIADFAKMLHVHPRHLSNTVQEVLGVSPCDIFENKLLTTAKELITATNEPIAAIARRLTYDPSNFTKFFKSYTGITPKKYRDQQLAQNLK